MATVNREGLTFKEWVCAAGSPEIFQMGVPLDAAHYVRAKEAWLSGRDPVQYRQEIEERKAVSRC